MAIDIWSPEIAERYDAQLREMADPALIEATTEFLVDFARDGGALEFAIGTGRIGLPLSETVLMLRDFSIECLGQKELPLR